MDRVFITYWLLIFFCSVRNNDSSATDEAAKPRQSPNPLQRNSSKRGGSPNMQHNILFPTEAPSGTDYRADFTDSPIPTPCPDGATFCESADDYPTDLIKDKLKKLPDLLRGILYEEELGSEVHVKFGDGTETELCTSRAKIVYPNKAQSNNGTFEFIVNDEEHKQGVRVELCTGNRGQCDLGGLVLSNDYKSRCIQKYITKHLVVLNRESSSNVHGVITKAFDFPSCCSCVISRENSGQNRFGGEDNTTPTNMTAPPTSKPIKGKPKSVD